MDNCTKIRTSSSSSNYVIAALIVCAGTFTAMLAASLWGMDKGFDVTDEGFDCLAYDRPHLYLTVTWAFHLLRILPLLPSINTVLQLRALHLACIIFGAFVLWRGVIDWVTNIVETPLVNSPEFKSILLLLTISGNLQLYGMIKTISYNGVTTLLVCSSVGLLFTYRSRLGRGNGNQRQLCSLTGAAGLAAGLCIFSKISSGLCLSLAELFLLFRFRMDGARVYILGLALSTVFVLCVVVSPRELLTSISLVPIDPSHGLPVLLKDYLVDLAKNLGRGTVVSLPFFAFCARRVVPKRFWLPAFVIATAIALVYTCVTSYFLKFNVFFLTGAWCYGLYAARREPCARKKEILSGLGCLASIPFIIACGTNIPIFLHATRFLGPWILMCGVLGGLLAAAAPSRNGLVSLFLTLLSGALCYHFFNGFVVTYNVPGSVFEQRYEMANSNLEGLKLHLSTVTELRQVQSLLVANGFQKDDPILAYNRPGVVYALGGRSVGLAYLYDEPHSFSRAVSFGMPQVSNRFFLILEQSDSNPTIMQRELAPEALAALAKVGAPFPSSFRFLGSAQGSMPPGEHFLVYAHRVQ